MATIAQQNQDDEENPAGGPTTVANTAGAGSGGGSGGGTSQVQSNVAPQNNQGYTDVASYLNANQGGSEKLGQQVSENLGKKYDQTKSGIDSSYSDFSGQVAGGYVPQNTDLINQVAADPRAAAGNSDTLSEFQKQLNNTYKGPNSWGDYGTQQGKVNEATQYSNLTKAPGGLNQLSQEVEGQTGGPMSQGINQLDTLLLGGNEGAMGQIQAAADPYKGLNDYINQQNMAGGQAVQAGQQAAQNSSQQALNAFTGANGTLTNLNASINNQALESKNKALAQQTALQDAIKGLYTQPVDNTSTTLGTYGGGSTPWYNSTNYSVGDLSPENLAALGIDQNQWNALRGAMQAAGTSTFASGHNFGANSPTSQIDLSNWLSSMDPENITAATTATSDQYAQMDAIQKLLGGKMTEGAINPAMANLAGTAPSNLNTFNYQNALDFTNMLEGEQEAAAKDMAQKLTNAADKGHADSKHGGFLKKLQDLAEQNMIYNVSKRTVETGKKLSDKAK